MIWFWAASAIAVVFGLWIGIGDRDPLSGFMMGLCALFVCGVVAIVVALGVGAVVYDPEPYSYEFDVLAAKDNSVTQGHFGIFGGTIDEEQYYFFYREFADGRIEQGRIREDSTVIYQDQEARSFIKVTRSNSEAKFWGVILPTGPTYEIHVPPGSVIENVEFDLE